MQNATYRRNGGRVSRPNDTPQKTGYRGQSRPQYGARRGPAQNNRRGNNGEKIHYSRFIARAVDVVPDITAFVPQFRFSELPLDADIREAIVRKGYDMPTPIQDGAIPHILRGSDVVGIANTGTGKTAAFLIPLIQKVRARKGEQVLIITPTRELAIQIDDELRALTRGMRVYSVVCVGGVNINPQLRALRQHNDFIIGTPGRLKDLMDRHALHADAINTIVLDEADRMLDMGFIADMRFVMGKMPKSRQTLFFSATMSPDIDKIIGEFLNTPVRVSVKTRDTSKNVDQDVVHIKATEHKVDVLHALLAEPEFDKVLIFGRTKHGVEKLATMLSRRGIEAESIHGNKDHNKRVRALNAFKTGKAQVLVATDVAARGLDIPSVSHVINYDVPTTYDDYVHRIGRTGRADKKGKALTFIGGGIKPADTDAPREERAPFSRTPRGRNDTRRGDSVRRLA